MPSKCKRCETHTYTKKMSWLNSDMICDACEKEEMEYPLYQWIKQLEHNQVLLGVKEEDEEKKKAYYNYNHFENMTWNEIKEVTPKLLFDVKKVADFNELCRKRSTANPSQLGNMLVIKWNGHVIANPLKDENGSKFVQPIDYYGIEKLEKLVHDYHHSFAVLLEP